LREQLQADAEEAGLQLSTLIKRVELKPERLRPSPFEPGHSSEVVFELFLDLRLPRPGRRPIAFTETLAASPISPPDEARSQVIAPAIATI
jgi:hypothetical protein